jgi:multidrug transporter EmrE-like cation transporter
MSLYTLFLMTGGMTVPYLWGILFLNEEITAARIICVAIIITAVVIFNSSGEKPDKKQLLLCVAVFFLNGITSVTSKTHQVSSASADVSSPEFACMVMIFKAIICIAALVIFASVFDGISYMLQLIGAESLPASVLYPFITGGSIILTSFAGVTFFKEKLIIRQWMAVTACFVGTLLFL